jgi:asparagine synthase (glutamine-hydrolysing)
MCGIAGIVRWDRQPVLEHEIRSMCDVMVHRGPDDDGVYVDGGVGLGMRRLSIIGLDSGRQPIANEDGSIHVVFNGEIYNYASLRRDLVQRGHVFRTKTDTECLVHLYEEHGPGLVDHLRGMFAFAIWDARARRLLLARDRLGIKPLYYAATDDGVIFASEIKPILHAGAVEAALDWQAVSHLFTFLTTPPAASIVAGIRKLEPAHVAVAAPGQPLRVQRYWDVRFEPDESSSEPQLIERLRSLLDEAVAVHRVADVPVGAFLSGGIDSSSVVALGARQEPGPIKTFSIGFEEAGFDELTHARDVARHLGTDHHDLVLRPDVIQIVEDLTWYLDEPFGDTSAIPTYMVSRLAREHVKVVLTGDGGDEVFAGYDRYVVEARERSYESVPRAVRTAAAALGHILPEGARGKRFLQHFALDGGARYVDAAAFLRRDDLRQLFRPDSFEHLAGHDPVAAAERSVRSGRDWLDAIQYFDLTNYLPQDVLTKVDRMTMAHSLEARPPLLDHRLIELAATIPARFRLRGSTTKYLFKQAMRGILPDRIIDRQKQGFAVPLARWLRRDLAVFVRDILLSERAATRGLFDLRQVEKLLRLNDGGRNLDLPLWTMLSFELWCRRFLDQRVTAPVRAHRPAAGALVAATGLS